LKKLKRSKLNTRARWGIWSKKKVRKYQKKIGGGKPRRKGDGGTYVVVRIDFWVNDQATQAINGQNV